MDRNSVVELMKSSKSEAEWDENCDLVKATFHGYPEFWFKEIIQSGLAEKVFASFNDRSAK
jgi:hypothetical protein